jgi:GxxExxY protein
MTENEIAKIVVDSAHLIHKKLGPGLLESAYRAVLAYELRNLGLNIESDIMMPLKYGELSINLGYRADIIVENKVIVELKSVEKVTDAHKKQLLTFLRVTDLRLGLLINFGVPLMKEGITRVVNGLLE